MTKADRLLISYISMAPLALAFERTVEGMLYSVFDFQRPILDLGCGEGLFSKLALELPIDTGIDPNARELRRAKQLGAYLELVQCRGDAIPKPDGSYATVFSNSVLEHIEDVDSVLKEVFRVLRPNGRFYFTVPCEKFDRYTVLNQLLTILSLPEWGTRYRNFFNKFWQHYHYYPMGKWEELARTHGFDVLKSHTYAPRSVCLLNDALVPLSIPAFLTKKLTNRWVLLPALRRVYCYPLYLLFRDLLKGADQGRDGGLVFIALTKKGTA